MRLPGNPIADKIGEGKPENQNHAMIFTRGTALQTVDMNQDGYFEEALKMRNMLQEFKCDRDEARPVAIVGFPEHQFSAQYSAAAGFAALEEFTFASLSQRTMAGIFDVRMHYGHPDLHHRLRAASRGSVSKSSKTLCVSEDMYGGINACLRGGRIVYRE